jgi:hypothetical protein
MKKNENLRIGSLIENFFRIANSFTFAARLPA